ncbi:SpoIIE family protein phosphatase [Streptomyces sp. NPDC051217]|uniref:SpoIIE family protein phosphatase n=1 Tax=Streptomyces sp. NPDC051217 TaxID=3365644 RepID=UPI0037A891A0
MTTTGSVPPRGLQPSMAQALYENSPVGLAFWDTDLRCTWFNEATVQQNLFESDTPLGLRAGEALAGESADTLEMSLQDVLITGAPVLDHNWTLGTGTGEERGHSISLFRLQDPQGQVLGVCLLSVETSDSWTAKRFNLLTDAGTQIGTTLDVRRTAQELADIAVPAIADYVTVDLTGTVSEKDTPLEHLSGTTQSIPAFYRAGLASIHPGFPESIWSRGDAVYVPPSSPFTEVLATRRAHLEPKLDTGPGNWLDRDPDRLRAIRETGMHSLIMVPLTARETVLGVAVFVRTDNPLPFCQADLKLVEGLTERAALSLDNALRYRQERRAALALQRNLLPARLDGGTALQIVSRYQPSDRHGDVGGDWYDAIPLSGGRIALVVGDVVGHGITAAATMGQLRTAVITLSNLGLSPAEVLAQLDQLALNLSDSHRVDTPATSATCVYAVYDPASGRVTAASAGHPPPAVVFPDGTSNFVALTPGAPIGVGLPDYKSVEFDLPKGGLMALYTDGLVESRTADIDEGLEQLRTALSQPVGDLEELASTVLTTMKRMDNAEDDIAFLLARPR